MVETQDKKTTKGKRRVEYFTKKGIADWKVKLLDDEKVRKQEIKYGRNDKPSSTMVDYFIETEWEKYAFEESVLNLIFERFCNEGDKKHVFARLIGLNSLYSTSLSIEQMKNLSSVISSKHEVFLRAKGQYISGLVKEIRDEFYSRYKYDPYSIVSKYCSHVNDRDYPIYDSYVATMLKWYREKYKECKIFGFEDKELNDYDKFRDVVKIFINRFSLEDNLKKTDEFLWTAGKVFFPQYVPRDLVEKYKPSKK